MILSTKPHKRRRRSKAEIEDLKGAILDIVSEYESGLTVRHLFYRLVSAGWIEKTEKQYTNVAVNLTRDLRRDGLIPVGVIRDGGRQFVAPRMFDSASTALSQVADTYQRDYWLEAPNRVQVWTEKAAIEDLIFDVTAHFGVPLLSTRGFCSESIVQEVGESLTRDTRPLSMLFLSDRDPSGAKIPEDAYNRVKHYAPMAEIELVHVAITPEQISRFNLPTRPTKTEGNRHAVGFEGDSVELDAMDPSTLQGLLREKIITRLDLYLFDQVKSEEEQERAWLQEMAGGVQ